VVSGENEWYKAAYYDPTKGGTGGYWLHATQSDMLGQNNPFTDANGANYNDGDFANGGLSGPGSTDVGSYTDATSYYGTFDQGGNLHEWNDAILYVDYRGLRGGSWNFSEIDLRSSDWYIADIPMSEYDYIGFRVASLAAVPEPSTYAAALGGVALVVGLLRRRKARGTL
jgi:formylglycine-generating enzyme required for sulfatase activity